MPQKRRIFCETESLNVPKYIVSKVSYFMAIYLQILLMWNIMTASVSVICLYIQLHSYFHDQLIHGNFGNIIHTVQDGLLPGNF